MASVTGASGSMASLSFCKPNQAKALSSNSLLLSTNGVSFGLLNLRSTPSRVRVITHAEKPEPINKGGDIVRKQLALPSPSNVTGKSPVAAHGIREAGESMFKNLKGVMGKVGKFLKRKKTEPQPETQTQTQTQTKLKAKSKPVRRVPNVLLKPKRTVPDPVVVLFKKLMKESKRREQEIEIPEPKGKKGGKGKKAPPPTPAPRAKVDPKTDPVNIVKIFRRALKKKKGKKMKVTKSRTGLGKRVKPVIKKRSSKFPLILDRLYEEEKNEVMNTSV